MAENTFLGLQPYTEADAYRFKGRTEESQELFRLIVRNDYTVCYAESGEGKTSLLNAGVFPLLRQNMFFPIAITFTSDDYQHTPDSFDTIIDRCIKDSIADYNEKNKGINIEYKLCSTDFQDTDSQAALQQELSKYSWWKLRNYKPQAMGLTFIPVFVFDQFEEVFNLPGSIVWTKKFFDWLEAVSSDSCPDEIVNKVRDIIGTNAAFPAIKEEKDFKAVFSLRKEFIGELDYWGMQKCFIPSLKDNRYCLKALTYEGAKKVMTQQQRFEETKVEQVLHYFVQQYSREPEKTIAENLPVIPALLLSVVCDSWEKDIHYFSDIDTNGIDDSLNKILEKFYDEALSDIVNELSQKEVNSQAESIRKNVETAIFALVDGNGKRVRRKSSELSKLDFDVKYKEILSTKRIIKISKVDGEDYVEIVHDALCPIIAKRKVIYLAAEAKKREEEKLREQAKKNRKRMMVATAIGVAIIGILLFFLWQNNRFLEEQEARNRTSAERDAIAQEAYRTSIERDSIVQLNESLNKQIIINSIQKDSIRQSLLEQQKLAKSLNDKNSELERQIQIIRQQQLQITQQEKIIAQMGNSIGFAYSGNGKYIAIPSSDKSIRIYDSKTGEVIHILRGHTSPVSTATFSPDDRYVVSASYDGTIRVWSSQTGRLLFLFEGHSSAVKTAVFSPNGKYILSASDDKTVRTWSLESGESMFVLEGHTDGVNTAFYSPDGRHVVSASKDRTIRIWDSENGMQIRLLEGHTFGVNTATFSPDGRKIVSSSWDNTVRIWDALTGMCIRTITGFDRWVNSAVFSPDGKQIAVVSENVSIWDIETVTKTLSIDINPSNMATSVSFSPDGKQIAIYLFDNTVNIFDLATGKKIANAGESFTR